MNIRTDLIARLAKEYKELRAEMRSCYISSTPFIIEIGGLYVTPEFKDGKTTGAVKLSVNPLRVTRFCRIDAARLAATVKNRAGETGKAVGVYNATRTRHDQVKELMKTLAQQ